MILESKIVHINTNNFLFLFLRVYKDERSFRMVFLRVIAVINNITHDSLRVEDVDVNQIRKL